MVRPIANDGAFSAELEQAAGKLVVVDFFATWCGPCIQFAPTFDQIAHKFPNALFYKVDIDKCKATAAAHNVSSVPAFLLFLNRVKVDSVVGGNAEALEGKISKWILSSGPQEEGLAPGQLELTGSFVTQGECECLNEADDHNLKALFSGGKLESDCDEQLILNYQFNQPVKLHSIKIKGPANAPKTLKLFINQPKTLDFDEATGREPTQLLELSSDDTTNGKITNLRYVKFQNVQNLTVFVVDNQAGSDVTTVERLHLYGSPLNATKMDDFKRVAGKKGEAH